MIINPDEPNEGKVQAELYRRAWLLTCIRSVGIMPKAPVPGQQLRASLAFYNTQTNQVFALVQIKHVAANRVGLFDATGIAWRYCQRIEDITATIDWVLGLAPNEGET